MRKSRVFLCLSLSFIAGVFLASFFQWDVFLVYALSVISIIAVATGYRNKKILVAGFAILFFTLGVWRTGQKLDILNNLPFEQKEFSGEAIVIKEPVEKDNYQQITAETSLGGGAAKSRILINASKYLEINYGDKLFVGCLLKIPENKEEFNYKMYLAKDKIYYLCEKPQIENLNKNSGNKLYAGILKLKNKLEENINRVIPYPESALANGLIFGGSSELPAELKNNFSRTGMTHIIAVSGYNVTIIAEYLILFFIFIGFWRKQAFWFAVAGIIIFVAMTGFPSSAVRAGVMGTLLIWAMKNGRLANSWNAIIFAGAIMLSINPLLLRWDIGFQLSFLATLGIISLAPFWEKRAVKKHKAFGITETIFLTISAQIFVLPIIFYNFHIFSAVSVLANALILPVIPVSMLLVFFTSVAGLLGNLFSLPFAWLSFLLLKYETAIINLLANLKWSSLEIKNFPVWAMIFWYLFLAGAVLFFKKWQKRKMEEGEKALRKTRAIN